MGGRKMKEGTDFISVDLKLMSEIKWTQIWNDLFGIAIDASQACGYCFMHGYQSGDSWEKAHDPDCKACEMFKKKVCVGPRLNEKNYEKYKKFLVVMFMEKFDELRQIAFKIREEIRKDRNLLMLEKKRGGKWKKVKSDAKVVKKIGSDLRKNVL